MDSISVEKSQIAMKLCGDASPKRAPQRLILAAGYGDELPVFSHARAAWQFYKSYFPDVRIDFLRDSDQIGYGQIAGNGYDLLIGCGEEYVHAKHHDSGYRGTGKWSAIQNSWQIFRSVAYWRYLLDTEEKPFFLYTATITSVVDIPVLQSVVQLMPNEKCYAGMPGWITGGSYDGLGFACGTNNLLSSDVLEILVNRYDEYHHYSLLPNDIWQALLLDDIPRIPLPFFSFEKPYSSTDGLESIAEKTKRLLDLGHFHFRVKSKGAEGGGESREVIDPWIMLKVMEVLLARKQHSEDAFALLILRLAKACGIEESLTFSAKPEPPFLTKGKRYFPLNDSEI